MAEPARPEVRYTAFLSYSHKDIPAAGRLHRRLEAYRLPKRLAGSQGARGLVPGRLWPIFRDREELPAATDLSETVREALAQSGALIILCSPHAAESLWVAEEIETFRKLHPDRPILAAILDGDPPDCFPKALRAFGRDGTWHEPLATDLRPGKDGAHLGLLKLVAGITGVGLDELVQRDAARRVRRVTAVTGAAVIVMLIMVVLAAVALDARREAERQRAEAKGLAEFMLNDLREKLKGVGRLDIMTDVNERALGFYDRQLRLSGLPADALMRARTLLAIGEDRLTRGEQSAAFAAFRDAHRATTALLTGAPDDPERIFAHGQSDFWIAEVYRARQQWAAAQRHYSAYSGAALRLLAIGPNNPSYMMEVGWGSLNLGIVQLNGVGNAVAAQSRFEEAVRWFERVARLRPEETQVATELANAHGWVADSYYARELWRDSLAARLRAHRIMVQLSRSDPLNAELAYRLAITERSVAHLSARTEDRGTAKMFMLEAYRRARRLVDSDPSNIDWLMLKTRVECDLLSPTLALDAGVPHRSLRREARAAIASLLAERNPNISQLSPCLPLLAIGE